MISTARPPRIDFETVVNDRQNFQGLAYFAASKFLGSGRRLVLGIPDCASLREPWALMRVRRCPCVNERGCQLPPTWCVGVANSAQPRGGSERATTALMADAMPVSNSACLNADNR